MIIKLTTVPLNSFIHSFIFYLAMASMVMPMAPPMHFSNFRSLDNGNYNVSWMFNSSMDTIHFMVEVRATGWIAFGVATLAPNNMVGYDVAIGGVQGGAGSLQVCWK